MPTAARMWARFEEGQLRSMIAKSGLAFDFSWISASQAVVSVVTPGGSSQTNRVISFPGLPGAQVAGPSVQPRAERAALTVNVERCGVPVEDATVTADVVPASLLPGEYPEVGYRLLLRQTSPGFYEGGFANAPGSVESLSKCASIAARTVRPCEIGARIGGVMASTGCATLAQGIKETQDGTLDMDVLEACRFAAEGLAAVCGALSKETAPNEICRSVQDVTSFFDPVGARITVSTNIPLVTQFLRLPTGIFVAFLPDFLTTQVKDVPAGTGDVGFDFQFGGVPRVGSFGILPADPAPGEEYVATATCSRLTPDSTVGIKVEGSDGFTRSTECVGEDRACSLTVPGGESGVDDIVTVTIDGSVQRTISLSFRASSQAQRSP